MRARRERKHAAGRCYCGGVLFDGGGFGDVLSGGWQFLERKDYSLAAETRGKVGKLRRRFVEPGMSGLHDELRPGRPRPISDERVAQLVRKTLKSRPQGGTHWSIREIANETRLSKSTVHRIWQAFGLQPHRQKHFKLSSDPFFVEKFHKGPAT